MQPSTPLLYSRQYGDPNKPCIILLHGFLGSSLDWQQSVAYLQKDYFCVCFDLPGHGYSSHLNLALNNGFQTCSQLLFNSIQQLKISKFHMLAYSLGGRLALHFARHMPHSGLQQLILESVNFNKENNAQARIQQDENWAHALQSEDLKPVLERWYQQSVFSDLTPRLKTKMIESRLQHPQPQSWAQCLLASSAGRQEDYQAWLQQQSAISYFHGSNDLKYSKLAQKLIHSKHINIVAFANAGHNIHFQYPEAVATTVKAILSSS